ncbi:NAD-dependent epimerase/dehydratase family protein [Haloarcula marina]|uniref:NAD-dependent epimerase/dehydratase family protein n=1 Tax=Haloarcula marina TaxID=2961574 RepID=UPI0020B7B596|nr:NAD(P)-dependent oxidoreductase [Halomicroarcula marina]
MSISTVAVTGGNGTIGRAILAHLNDRGYETVNIARGKRREEVSNGYVTADLLDAGETYGAIAKADADAIIHMGTIPGPGGHPQFQTYQSNVMSAVHVLEASESLGLDACCLASSINAMGTEHQQRDPQVEYLPIDEDHPRTPDDEYGIAKHAMEVTADGFGRRPPTDLTLSTLRYPWVTTKEEMREYLVQPDRSLDALHDVHPSTGHQVLFSYLAMADAVSIARKAIEADYGGHETFWAVAGDTTANVPTADVVEEFYPDADVREDLTGHEAFFDLSKAKRLLDWEPEHSWRDL